jgi:hypothetical protein
VTTRLAGPMKTPIETIVERRAKLLLEKAVAGESVSADDVAELTRLTALADLATGARAPRRPTWPIVAAALVTLALVSALLYSRVSATDIELEAKLSEVSFTVTARQAVLGTQNLVAVGAGGLQRVQFPYTDDEAPAGLDAVAGELCNAEIQRADDDGRPGVVSLNSLAVPGGTRVSLTPQTGNAVTLLLTPPPSQHLSIALSVRGSVRTVARCPGGTIKRADHFPSPQLIELVGATAAPLALQLTTMPSATIVFSSQMGVADISMLQVDELVEQTGPLTRSMSSLVSGALYLESLNGKRVPLRPYEELRLSGSAGTIRRLSLSAPDGPDAGTLALEAQATVQGMTVGRDPNARSLMPTYLEWLSARQGLALLWGSTLYLTGVLASVLRWLRVSQ